jgi:hypothetical protein
MFSPLFLKYQLTTTYIKMPHRRLFRKSLSEHRNNLMLTAKNNLHAAIGAPESTLIQSFSQLSNIKFAELRIQKVRENSAKKK